MVIQKNSQNFLFKYPYILTMAKGMTFFAVETS